MTKNTNTATSRLDVDELARYIEAGLNILIIGPAGTGKTQALREASAKAKLKMAYYSASTMDPYVDLVGIPTTVKNEETGKHELAMVRKQEINEAEVIFADEFNRAEHKTMNGFMETMQFKSINGEALPKMRSFVAAVNPVDNQYTGTYEMDQAVIDRFDLYFTTDDKADLMYFIQKFGKVLGQRLVRWQHQNDQEKCYISPRRLEKIGHAWLTFGTRAIIEGMMPPAEDGYTPNVKSLYRDLEDARQLMDGGSIDYLTEFKDLTPQELIKAESKLVQRFLDAMETLDDADKEKVRHVLATGLKDANLHPMDRVVSVWSEILVEFSPVQIEIMTETWTPLQKAKFQSEVNRLASK